MLYIGIHVCLDSRCPKPADNVDKTAYRIANIAHAIGRRQFGHDENRLQTVFMHCVEHFI